MAQLKQFPQTPLKPVSPGALLAPIVSQTLDVARALRSGEMAISLSEMLGCDYVFVQHPAKTLLMHNRHLADTLTDLVRLLAMPPTQKIFIGLYYNAQNELRFQRFNCEWQGKKAIKVEATPIVDAEQWEFTRMMYDCSSPYSPNLG